MSVQLREMRRRLDAAKSDGVGFCQPTLVAAPPNGPGWLHEIKHDGYRMAVRRDSGGIRLITRNGHDWASRYPSIVSAANALRCRSCIIDGEVVVCDVNGLADFNLLRHGRQVKPAAFLYAFDLLELDGRDLKRESIEERKDYLERLLKPGNGLKSGHGITYVDHLDEEGDLIFAHACALGCEGVVSKRKGSRYRAGRSREWLKTKNPASPAARRPEEEDWSKW